jgi:hypothetical protein
MKWLQVTSNMTVKPETQECSSEQPCGVVSNIIGFQDVHIIRGPGPSIYSGRVCAEGKHLGRGDSPVAHEHVKCVDTTHLLILSLEVELVRCCVGALVGLVLR